MMGQLPPVGSRIQLTTAAPPPQSNAVIWLQSGTAALALALLLLRYRHQHMRRPEVCIPAYGCPDMVSAAVFAKVKPVLVDIGTTHYGYDENKLEQAINANTLAIIAPSLVGMPFTLNLPPRFQDHAPPNLIHDCAQALPINGNGIHWHKHALSIISTGRGKPLNLLGGGALICPSISTNEYQWLLTQLNAARKSPDWQFKFKAKLLNALLKPLPYALLTRLPGLGIGETHYSELKALQQLDATRLTYLKANLQPHLQPTQPQQTFLRQHLPTRIQLKLSRQRLLRFPLLARSPTEQQQLILLLNKQGLGASPMYDKALVDIKGICNDAQIHSCDNARQFAACFFTLPLHAGVKDKHLNAMCDVINQHLKETPSNATQANT